VTCAGAIACIINHHPSQLCEILLFTSDDVGGIEHLLLSKQY
jgi:hypothetical protein